MIRAYMYKLIRSPLLYISILGVAAVCSTDLLSHGIHYGNVVDRMNIFLNIGVYRKAVAVFCALPFTANFADEWSGGITLQCIARKGVKKYAAANILLCWFTAMLTTILGMLGFCGFLSIFIPFSKPYVNPYGFIFGELLHSGSSGVYILLRIIIFASSCAMWAVIGMLLSAFFPNKYAAICAPFAASYVVERITIQFPPKFNLWYVSLSLVEFDSDLLGFLYCVGIFAAIAAASGIGFYIVVRKRMRNEFT